MLIFPLSRHEVRFKKSPSTFGMVVGTGLGIFNGILFSAILFGFFPTMADLNFFLIAVNSGLFTGLFIGGLIGLYAEWKKRPFDFFIRGAAIAQFIFILFLAALVLLQLNAPPPA